MKRLYRSLGRAYPKGYRESIGESLRYSGSGIEGTVWLGSILLMTMILVAAVNLLWSYFGWGGLFYQLTVNAVGVFVLQAAAYVIPYYSAERRAKAVEAVLPSFYQLMASYLRSGMTAFQALKSASKKEFGVLQEELDVATSKALGTQSFNDALLDISRRVKSENLRRSTELMARAIASGGSLARLLEESALNLVENRSMRREIIATSRTYTLMVVFAVVVGAPLLLSISTRFNERLIELTSTVGTDVADVQGLQLGLIAGGGSIDPGFLNNAVLLTLALTSLISSFLVAIIVEGKEKYGFKYALFFVPLTLGLFYAFRALLTSFL